MKAIVARKRPVKRPQTTDDIEKPAQKSLVHLSETKNLEKKTVTTNTNVESRNAHNSFSNIESHKSSINSTDNGLILNIATDSIPSARPKPKQKLSQAERLRNMAKQKSERTKNNFTKKPFDKTAMKSFNQHNNLIQKNPQNEVNSADAQESGVNLAARKANAFRVVRPEDKSVKKVGLFTNSPNTPVMGQRFVKPIAERLFDGTKIDSLDIHPHAVKNLADILSIVELTTVQKKTIPLALEGKHVLNLIKKIN